MVSGGRRSATVAAAAVIVVGACAALTWMVLRDDAVLQPAPSEARSATTESSSRRLHTQPSAAHGEQRPRDVALPDPIDEEVVLPPPPHGETTANAPRLAQPTLAPPRRAADRAGRSADAISEGRALPKQVALSQTVRFARRRSTDPSDGPAVLHVVALASEDAAPLRQAFVEPIGDAVPLGVSVGAAGEATLTFHEPTTCDVRITSPGRVRALRHGIRLEPGDDARFEVRLPIATSIVGAVVGRDELPLGGAELAAYDAVAWHAAIPFGPMPASYAETVTDEDGHYVLANVPRMAELIVVARADAHATELRRVTTALRADASSMVDVALGWGETLVARVRDAAGDPLEDAWVVAWPTSRVNALTGTFRGLLDPDERRVEVLASLFCWKPWQTDHALLRRARTDASGIARLEGVAAREELCVMAFHGRDRSRGIAALEPREGPAELHLAERVGIRVRVTLDGVPQGGATARVFSWPARPVTLRTGNSGETHWISVPDGPVRVDVSAAANSLTHFLGAPDHASSTFVCDIQQGGVIAGRVIDAQDRPVATVLVGSDTRRARSGPDGRFRMEGVSRHARALTVEHPGYVPFRTHVVPPDEAVTVQLLRGGDLRVSVTLPDDIDPPTWHRIVWTPGWGTEAIRIEDRVGPPPSVLELPSLAHGRRHVGVWAEGCFAEWTAVEVGADAEEPSVLALHAAPFLRGRIVGGGGRSFAEAFLTLQPVVSDDVSDALVPPFTIRVGDGGGFTVRAATRLPTKLTATAAGFLPAVETSTPGSAADVVLTMPVPTTLRGFAYLRDGRPAAGAAVRVRTTLQWTLGTTVVGADGRFEVRVPRVDCVLDGGVEGGETFAPVIVTANETDNAIVLRPAVGEPR